MAMVDAEHSLVWEKFFFPVEDFNETMVELIVSFDGDEAPPPPTLHTIYGGSGSKSDNDDSIKKGNSSG